MDGLIAKYKKSAIESARLANRSELKLQKLKIELESLIEDNIINYKDGYYLPSKASYRVLNKHRIVLNANKDLYMCSQQYLKVKELASIQISPRGAELHNDMRLLRDNLRTEFMTDVNVTESIKTIKHQEAAFDSIFKELLTSYSKGKMHYTHIQEYMQFLSDGMYQLSNLGRYLYNYSNMAMQEMEVEEATISSDIRTSSDRSRGSVLQEDSISKSKTSIRKRRVSKISSRS